MSRICITLLVALMFCIPGCGPSERERFEATEKLLSVWDMSIKGSRADYVRILISEGANVYAKTKDDNTPLVQACWAKHLEIATLLIEAGADVNAKTKDGWTPLSVSANPEIIKLLKARGALE